MEKTIIDYQKLNEKSIYGQLKEALNKYKNIEIKRIQDNFSGEEQIDRLEDLRIDFEIFEEKLEYANEINELNIKEQQRYLQNLVKIDCFSNISKTLKTYVLISYTSLVKIFPEINERSYEEILVISSCAHTIDVDLLNDNIGILIDRGVSKAIISASDDIYTQVDIGYDIMDNQAEMSGKIVEDNYDECFDNAINTIKNYTSKHRK